MTYTKSSLLCIALALAFCSTIDAINITEILGTYPQLTLFNKVLIETKLAEQINKLKAVTILAVDNAGMGSLSGKSLAAVKAIMSTMVLTHYYDVKLLIENVGSHTELETLFQSSGAAIRKQGYIYVALINQGEMAFGFAAAAPNALYDCLLVGILERQTDVVSVFQVNKLIVPAGMEGVSATVSRAELGGVLPLAVADAPSVLPLAPASASSRLYFGFFAALSAFLPSLFLLA